VSRRTTHAAPGGSVQTALAGAVEPPAR